MSSFLPNPFSTWAHFLSLPHFRVSYPQASTIYSFPEWSQLSLPLTFQPMFIKHL